MGLDGGTQTYIRDLEEHLMRAVFDGVSPIRSDAAVSACPRCACRR